MKNVNVNCFVCKDVMIENEAPSFLRITDVLFGRECENGVLIDNFNIVVFVNIIQAKEESELFTNYECSMRITSHLGRTAEVARFRLSDNIQTIEKKEGVVCRSFGINKFYIPLKEYVFPDGDGRYMLKILIRKREDDVDIDHAKPENDTQFMMPIYIKNIENKNCIE